MLLKRWEPFAEYRRFDRGLNRVWGQPFRPLYTRPHYWQEDGHVAIDVFRDADNLVVRAALPGVRPEDAEVTVAGGTLSIKGEVKSENEIEADKYLHRELRYGSFHRMIALPRGLDTAKAEAAYKNGILTVTIPRHEESKGRLLEINTEPAEENKS